MELSITYFWFIQRKMIRVSKDVKQTYVSYYYDCFMLY